MSGTADTPDAEPDEGHENHEVPVVEVSASRIAEVGGLPVARALPQRSRRTIGAWCFADHFGPVDSSAAPMHVGPHPHIGLQTVTWLIEGEVLHRDSLGSEQLIRPGQLNLMSAGRGVAHAEETPLGTTGGMHGIQLWIAQPEATRHGDAAFEHHPELPTTNFDDVVATVLVGSLGSDLQSTARTDSPLVGVDLRFDGRHTTLPLEASFEHGLVVTAGAVEVEGTVVRPGAVAYLGIGRRSLPIDGEPGSRALLLGGVPFAESIRMWWNFVARTDAELEAAFDAWQQGDASRFPDVASPLARIDAPRPHWLPAQP